MKTLIGGDLNMKIYTIALGLLFLSTPTFGGTCTSISRTNSSPLSVLTSTKYNTDHNTAYTFLNDYDGGCIDSGSLESDALNTTQFAPMLKGIKEGCKVSYSSATQISIGKCLAAVNGEFVTTSVATTAAFGCTGCSSEVAATTYYAYIQTGSSSTTLTPLILTTAPNEDGYDNSGNKVLARFYNNASSDIDQYSIDQWHVNHFIPQKTGWVTNNNFTATGFGTVTDVNFKFRRDGKNMDVIGYLDTGTTTAATITLILPTPYKIDNDVIILPAGGAGGHLAGFSDIVLSGNMAATNHGRLFLDGSSVTEIFFALAGNAEIYSKGVGTLVTSGNAMTYNFSVPIEGWED